MNAFPLVLAGTGSFDVRNSECGVPLGVEVVELVQEDEIAPEPQHQAVMGRLAGVAPRDVRRPQEADEL